MFVNRKIRINMNSAIATGCEVRVVAVVRGREPDYRRGN